MNFHDIGFITNFITLFIAYCISSVLSGWFRAFVANAMGDDTGKQMGYLTLNPLVHIDIIGVLMFLTCGFGWGKYVPIDEHNITQPYRLLKRICAFFADSFMYLLLAVSSFTLLLRLYGFKALYVTLPMIYSGDLHLSAFTQVYPERSSLFIVFAFILVAIIYMSVMLAVMKFIFNSINLIITHYFPELNQQGYLIFLVSMIFILFLSYPLRLYVLYMIDYAGCYFAAYLGGSW